MANPRITYNSKNIDIPSPPLDLSILPTSPRTCRTTLTGEVEVIEVPRVDIRVRMNFPIMDSLTTRVNLEKWWQWASHGNSFSLALDSSKTVDTQIGLPCPAGGSTLIVLVVTGITQGQIYKLIDGPNYELVTVASISGTQVSLTAGTDLAFGTGAIFRDPFYWPGLIRDDTAPSPIRIVSATEGSLGDWPPTRFFFSPEFYEDIRKGVVMSGTYTPTLTNGTNVAASTAFLAMYMRLGDIVHVAGQVSIDPTADDSLTRLGISLPISSDLAQIYDLSGVLTADGSTGDTEAGAIYGDVANNRATVDFTSRRIDNHVFQFVFTYRVL